MSLAAATTEAKQWRQDALEDANPQVVTIGGASLECEAHLSALEWQPRSDGGGMVRIQRLYVNLAKAKLPARPAKETVITHDGVEFKLSEIGGDNATDVAWHITAVRFPK